MTLPRSSLAVLMAALVAAGCSDSDSSPPMTMADPEPQMEPEPEPESEPPVHEVMLPSDTGALGAGMIMVEANHSETVAGFIFACTGPMDCNIEVYENLGVLMAKSTGGMATVAMMPMYPPVSTPTAGTSDFLNDEMLPPRSAWTNPKMPPMTKKEAYADAIKDSTAETADGHARISDGVFDDGQPMFGMGTDATGASYVMLDFGGRMVGDENKPFGALFGDGMSDLSAINGFAGYSLEDGMIKRGDNMHPGMAHVFSDGMTHFGVWALDYDAVMDQRGVRAQLGAFAQFTGGQADNIDNFSNPLMGGTASYSGGAAGFMAGDEDHMNDTWTGVVMLDADFGGATNATIGGMIRSASIPTIYLGNTDVAASGMGMAQMAGMLPDSSDRWRWAFSDSGKMVIGTVDVGNVIGAYGANRTQ